MRHSTGKVGKLFTFCHPCLCLFSQQTVYLLTVQNLVFNTITVTLWFLGGILLPTLWIEKE